MRLHWPTFSNVPAELREQLQAEGVIFIADKVYTAVQSHASNIH